MVRICILDAKTLGADIDLSIFEKVGDVAIYQTTKPDEVVERIKDREVIITNKVLLNQSNLEQAVNLRLICIAATGVNNVDLEYARSKRIAVTNVAGYSTTSVAQHTFAMLFYLIHSLSYYDTYVKSKEYAESDIFTHLGRPYSELAGKTWGIIGLGAIGREVAALAEAFGCKVLYFSTTGKNNNENYQRVDLDTLLGSSDMVSIHSPLNEQTKNLIGYSQIKAMKKTAVLLNLGRGGIVNEGDLAKALDEGLIKGAALDVLGSEPVKGDNPLFSIKEPERLLITPHIAWASVEARMRLIKEILLNIESFINGEERNRVC